MAHLIAHFLPSCLVACALCSRFDRVSRDVSPKRLVSGPRGFHHAGVGALRQL